MLTGPLEEERYRHATDAQGRLLVPNAELMALELLKDSAPDRARATLERLKKRLLDYDDPALSASATAIPDARSAAAVSRSQRCPRCWRRKTWRRAAWKRVRSMPGRPTLRPTALPGVWQFASTRGRVVTLASDRGAPRPDARWDRRRNSLPADVSLAVLPPGKEFEQSFLSLPAGATLPELAAGPLAERPALV